MRILVYGINYAPELTGIGKYSGEMAEWLAAQGHEVRVITAPPYYPAWRVADGYSSWLYRREFVPDTQSSLSATGVNVVVYRCPLWVPARPSGLKRLVHLASFALGSLPVMLRHIFWRPKVVFVIEPPLMCAPTALLVSKLCGAKSWLHIQDFEVDAAFDLGILPSGYLRNVVLFFERAFMRSFDRISTISPGMMTRLAQKGVKPEKTTLFPNWADTHAIFPMTGPSPMRAELGILPKSTVVLYSGNMSEKQGLEVVLDTARSLVAEEQIRFVLCGAGAARERLLQAYADLPNVLWLPLQPLEKMNDLLNIADIHVLPQRADAADLVMPSKLTGILASGRPVVVTAEPGTHLADAVSDCGIVIPPDDIMAFAQALMALSNDVARRKSLGNAARIYAEKHMGKDAVLDAFGNELNILAYGQTSCSDPTLR